MELKFLEEDHSELKCLTTNVNRNLYCLIKNMEQLDRRWSGVWEVEFVAGEKELCVLYKHAGKLTAKKIRGNGRVAAGQITWELPASAGSPKIGATVAGRSQWAWPDGVDMHWRDCTLTFQSRERIVSGNEKVFVLKFHM